MRRPYLKPRLSLIGYLLAFVLVASDLPSFLDNHLSHGPLKTIAGVLDGVDSFSFFMFHKTTITVVTNTGSYFSLTINADPSVLAELQTGTHVTALADARNQVYDLSVNSKQVFGGSSKTPEEGSDLAIAGIFAALSFGWALVRDRRRGVV